MPSALLRLRARLPAHGLMLALALPLVTPGVQAQAYKWVDEQGKLHFSDKPSARHQNQSVDLTPQAAPSGDTPSVGATKAAPVARQVVMYGASWCAYCKQARAYFRAKGIDYVEYDIEADRKAMATFKSLGGKGVPLIVVGKQRLQGFSVAGFEALYR